MKLSSLVLVAALGMTSVNVLASTPNFQNITEGDFTSIMNDFSALSSYTSVSGASGRGSIFGFEEIRARCAWRIYVSKRYLGRQVSNLLPAPCDLVRWATQLRWLSHIFLCELPFDDHCALRARPL